MLVQFYTVYLVPLCLDIKGSFVFQYLIQTVPLKKNGTQVVPLYEVTRLILHSYQKPQSYQYVLLV